jgi:hypothetical protein
MWRRGVGAKLVNLPWEGGAGFRMDIRAGTWHRIWFVTTSRHVEGWHEGSQGGVGRPGGRSILGWPWSCRFSSRWLPSGSKVGMGVFTVSLASYLVAVGPWIHVLAPDWSRVCFFVSMTYHGHMGACVVARRHVAWCGSHRSHTISCAYLSHLNFKGGKWYIHFDPLGELVAMVESNLAFDTVSNGALYKSLVLSISVGVSRFHCTIYSQSKRNWTKVIRASRAHLSMKLFM